MKTIAQNEERKQPTKELIKKFVQEQPDDSSYDEILRELAFFSRMIESEIRKFGVAF
jgi:hypothetical protein